MQIIIGGGPQSGKTTLVAFLHKLFTECGIPVKHVWVSVAEASDPRHKRPSSQQALGLGRYIQGPVEIIEGHSVGTPAKEPEPDGVYCPYCRHLQPDNSQLRPVDTGLMRFNVQECAGCHKHWLHSDTAKALPSFHPRRKS